MALLAGAGLAIAALGPARGAAAEAIKTLAAIYGTPSENRTCDATEAVARACDGKASCTVVAGNALCGDPDFGTPKSLNVEYQCGPAVAKSITAFEETEAHLRCE